VHATNHVPTGQQDRAQSLSKTMRLTRTEQVDDDARNIGRVCGTEAPTYRTGERVTLEMDVLDPRNGELEM
jgi:hypothetical protein